VISSKVPNPLREHNHYNYVITLGILDSDEFNFPSMYRTGGDFVQSYIIKSSGGNLDNHDVDNVVGLTVPTLDFA
jgi:hypothetical protein